MSAIRCTYPKFRSLLETPFQPNTAGKVFISGDRSRASYDIYTTPQKTATITNPIVLDSNGEKNIFVEATTDYTFSFSDSVDDPLDTVDECLEVVEPITVLRSITGSATVGSGTIVQLIEALPIPSRVKTARFIGRVSSGFAISKAQIVRKELAYTVFIYLEIEATSSLYVEVFSPWLPVTQGEVWALQSSQNTGVNRTHTGILDIEFRYED